MENKLDKAKELLGAAIRGRATLRGIMDEASFRAPTGAVLDVDVWMKLKNNPSQIYAGK